MVDCGLCPALRNIQILSCRYLLASVYYVVVAIVYICTFRFSCLSYYVVGTVSLLACPLEEIG